MKGPSGKYLGIQRYRFYIKCGGCSRPLTFLTDPQNADYEMESGGTRNYEVWHDERKTNEQFEKDAEEDEKMDSMKALENRVLESQREMAELDALEEIRAMNARHVKIMGKRGGGGEMDAAQAVLNAREANLGIGQNNEEDEELNENGLTNDEEELVKSIKFGRAIQSDEPSAVIHRLDEEDEILAEKKRKEEAEALILNKRKINDDTQNKPSLPVFKVKRKKRKDADENNTKRSKTLEDDKRDATQTTIEEPSKPESSSGSGGALSGLLGYGSSSDSD